MNRYNGNMIGPHCGVDVNNPGLGRRLRLAIYVMVPGALAVGIALCLVLQAMAQTAPDRPAPDQPHYELAATINPTHGFVKEAVWLDSDRFLTLTLSPDGASVWRTSFDTLEMEKFISGQFIEQNLCSAELAPRLSWVLSPAKRYIFFMWSLNDGTRKWLLLDVSAAPQFKLKRFAVPPQMQIAEAVFSPDDRYAVFGHDSFREGSDTSILVFDLTTGDEVWRIQGSELSFIDELWWGGAIYDTPRFNVLANLQDGQFRDGTVFARCDINSKKVEIVPDQKGMFLGTEALWGKLFCVRSQAGTASPFVLKADIPGQRAPRNIPLSAQPTKVCAMPEMGLALLINAPDPSSSQLWLVDVMQGDKILVDGDAADFSLAPDGKVLVRAKKKNELRVYELVHPAEPAEPTDKPAVDDNRGQRPSTFKF